MFNEIEVALNIAPLIFFPMILFSGFYVNSDSIQSFVSWVETISPLRYVLEALVYVEFEGTNFVPNPIAALNFNYGYWDSMLYLLIIGLTIRTLSLIALIINARMA